MTDRERVLTDALRSVEADVDAYEAARNGDGNPVPSAFLVLNAIREDVRRALDEAMA